MILFSSVDLWSRGLGLLRRTSAKISLCSKMFFFMLERVIAAMMTKLPIIKPWPQASRTSPWASVGLVTRSPSCSAMLGSIACSEGKNRGNEQLQVRCKPEEKVHVER